MTKEDLKNILELADLIFVELTKDGALHYMPLFTSMRGEQYRKFESRYREEMVNRIAKILKEY